MNSTSMWWVWGWTATAILGTAVAVTTICKLQDRRYQRQTRQANDAKFCAAHDIDWNATAPEKTP